MTPEEIRKIVLAFPGAEDGVSYGQPSFKVNNKFFTRLRAEDQSMVLLEVSQDEREMLMEAEPATFHITPHYKDYRASWPGSRPCTPARCTISSPAAGARSRRRRWSRNSTSGRRTRRPKLGGAVPRAIWDDRGSLTHRPRLEAKICRSFLDRREREIALRSGQGARRRQG
ncbi:MAG: MmcQ/YjbR family DNA-binding protein [Phenylobacterium sp.]|uniref:MmcQ/YjbR family DNA-binding protein n=1 Tax=Phenylobacterium sp. TaxID=1871053 RepID=UPI0027281F52|nr:MmcQ/YjbR family DNA-binding protein [Phenylobacterium sp.]MDO9431909.1 MmcQ/YjbR family DNA-binding protein [Phenylobacterium sp.]